VAKANLVLPNGTKVSLEGDVEDIHRLLELYGGGVTEAGRSARGQAAVERPHSVHAQASAEESSQIIANAANECAEAHAMSKRILDARSQLNRILLPLYVVAQYRKEIGPLAMADISDVTRKLGALVEPPNVAKVLRTSGARYVLSDAARGKGAVKRFSISRRGLEHVKSVLKGDGAP
jgi:hypothetical protein